MPRASFSSHRPRLVHAVLLALGCTAIAVPLLSNLDKPTGVIDVTRGYVTAERPIDRLLSGDALGSRRLSASKATPPLQAPSRPRTAPPDRLDVPVADTTPDRRIAHLHAGSAPAPAIVETPLADISPKSRFTEPRRKPAIPKRVAILPAPESLTLEAAPNSIAAALPTVLTIPTPAPPPPQAATAPRIALVVTAAGLHEATTRKAIETLPGGVTLAFAPIGSKTGDLARAAAAAGHTVLAEVPMEPMNIRRDPGGPLTLRTADSGPDNIARLDKVLARVPGATGISSYLGAKFSRSEEAATPVVGEIAARGLFLFENQPNGQSRLGTLAKTRDVPYAAGALAIDAERDAAHIIDRLSALEAQARRDGIAIGVATTYRETIATLENWITDAEKRGIVFVPVTRINEAG